MFATKMSFLIANSRGVKSPSKNTFSLRSLRPAISPAPVPAAHAPATPIPASPVPAMLKIDFTAIALFSEPSNSHSSLAVFVRGGEVLLTRRMHPLNVRANLQFTALFPAHASSSDEFVWSNEHACF